VSGTVIEAGERAKTWVGKQVVVPAVIPCGECDACLAGRGQICPNQIFPGNDMHGGFATHLRVPARGLCPVPQLDDSVRNPKGLQLAALAVIADAISTPYQAIERSGLARGDLAVFVGTGGVGGFGVQLAAAREAVVAAVDIDTDRLALMSDHGAALTLNARELDFKAIRASIRDLAKAHDIPSWRQRIFETSGTEGGQTTAFGLLGHGSYLSVVGFTQKKVELRLSNLMAYDATAEGNWGCLPEHYPTIVELVLSGKVSLEPFIEFRPMSSINETFAEIHEGKLSRRVILTPES
jgi:6-hydroxycyclohex-1-ene-1-carbonyl-CoA dehydrogenase